MKLYKLTILTIVIAITACKQTSKLPAIKPDVITEKTVNDSDDPAIWVNPNNAEESIVFGTDKETNGAIYAFNLNGKIIPEKTIKNIKRPNNIDLAYGFQLNDSTKTDVIVFTEREQQQIRLFSVPDMKPLDNGGFKVFTDTTEPEHNLPMGVALYKSPISSKLYAIVSRKTGPKENYLYQYELTFNGKTTISNLVRKFGAFSGKKEIEAIAVDNELGFVYYSDEQHCIRKYYAEPKAGNKEISCFGSDKFMADIEGIAIAKTDTSNGYLIVSNQQKGEFNIFDRQTNKFIKSVNLSTTETDGCEVTTIPLGSKFPNGLFVAMNDNKDFYFYDLNKVIK
ncbi:Phytase [Tenacibaculum sp. 190524A02b]|uniref:3-phytase n=1 Tax=Tenacibaculum vairaonense TaxID=3137860 RepID=A0ABM9PK00_9FLAO